MTHAALLSPESPEIPWMEWGSVRSYVNKAWDPENCPHHSIIGLTGSGKSYLAVKGILRPMCALDRVLIIDSKQDDKLVSSIGNPVRELPRQTWYSGMGRRRTEPYKSWYRLQLTGTPDEKRMQVGKTLARVYKEGNWVVFIDELKHITGPRKPFLRLGAFVDEIYIMGRSRKISIVAGTQAPKDVTTSFYDQSSFAWIGRIRDEERQKRLLEIGGLSRKELPYIATLKRRQWLLSADNGEYFARTMVA